MSIEVLSGIDFLAMENVEEYLFKEIKIIHARGWRIEDFKLVVSSSFLNIDLTKVIIPAMILGFDVVISHKVDYNYRVVAKAKND
jgi:hypothetical protein